MVTVDILLRLKPEVPCGGRLTSATLDGFLRKLDCSEEQGCLCFSHSVAACIQTRSFEPVAGRTANKENAAEKAGNSNYGD